MGIIKIEKDTGRTSRNSGKFFNNYDDSNYQSELNAYQSIPDISDSKTIIIDSKTLKDYNESTIDYLNNEEEYNYDFASDHTDTLGMEDGRLKNERDIFTTCLATFAKIIIISGILLVLLYLGFSYLDTKVELFPYQSSYTSIEFNEYIRRSFILLFLLLSFGCSILMIIMTNVVSKQFKNHYLSKINIYIYDVFTILLNTIIYIFGGWCMFNIINNLYEKFVFWQNAGTILGSVNIETINIFKYVITSVIAIFIVINSFSICGIVHKKNKFVFENI